MKLNEFQLLRHNKGMLLTILKIRGFPSPEDG